MNMLEKIGTDFFAMLEFDKLKICKLFFNFGNCPFENKNLKGDLLRSWNIFCFMILFKLSGTSCFIKFCEDEDREIMKIG